MATANVILIGERHEQLSLLKKAGYCAKYVELAFSEAVHGKGTAAVVVGLTG